MPSRNLLRTTTFRLTIAYLAIFLASATTLLVFIYWTTTGAIDRETEQTIDAEITGLAEQYRQRGLTGLLRVVTERSAGERGDEMLYLLAGPRYVPIAGNLATWPQAARGKTGWVNFLIESERAGKPDRRQSLAASYDLPGGYHLLVGRDMKERSGFRQRVLWSLAWSVFFVVSLGLVGGYWISHYFIRRVEAINRMSGRIRSGDFSHRVALSGADDEFDQLARNLNAMLDQIERLMTGMRQVTANIAHDLRTPLNRMRARLEVTLFEAPDADRCRQVMEETIAEADQLIATFNALLSIADAESGTRAESLEPVALGPLVDAAAELYEPLAEEKGLSFAVGREGAADDAATTVRGNRHLLSQAIANLIDNAVKYTPAGGAVRVTVRAGPAGPEVAVADTGPGIPPESRQRVLDRFVRLEQSRSTPGNGLGLSLVNAVARLHGAALAFTDTTAPGATGADPARPGLTVTLAFPPMPPAAAPARRADARAPAQPARPLPAQ